MKSTLYMLYITYVVFVVGFELYFCTVSVGAAVVV